MSCSPHTEHCVDVAADPLDVGGHQVGLGGLLARVLHHRLHGAEDPLLLVGRVQVGHVSGVQDAVHILQKRLTLYLGGSETPITPRQAEKHIWNSSNRQ